MSSRSTTPFALLGMLSIRPMSGYDIKKLIENSISYFWTESYGQIYPILKKLVTEKLVTRTTKKQSGKPDRHVYALTSAGRRVLRDWLARSPAPKVDRNELLLKLFFGEEVAFPNLDGSISAAMQHERGVPSQQSGGINSQLQIGLAFTCLDRVPEILHRVCVD